LWRLQAEIAQMNLYEWGFAPGIRVAYSRFRLMGDDRETQRSEADAELAREILHGRKFSVEEAIARMAGPGAFKGESPVVRMQQAEFEIESWITNHLSDAGGALGVVLRRSIKRSDVLLENYDEPLAVLSSYLQRILDSDYLLEELVRAADVEWGRAMDERPYFQKVGSPCHPDDPYTRDSVRGLLSNLLAQLAEREH
jgi:hypothetical protein